MAFFYILVSMVGALLSWWAGSKAWDELNTAEVAGKVVLQDGASPANTTVTAYYKEKLVTSLNPNPDGAFNVSLKNRAYTFEFKSNGYDTVKRPVVVQDGTPPIDTVILSVSKKSISLILTDRDGVPYKQLPVVAVKKRIEGQPYISWQSNFKTDDRGEIKILDVGPGEYYIDMLPPNTTQNSFLRTRGFSNFTGEFVLQGALNTYNIVLPRVVLSDLSGCNSASSFKPTSERYFAQAIELKKPTRISGFGLAVGLGGPWPDRMGVYADNSAKPAKVIIETHLKPSQAAISFPAEGSFVSVEPVITMESGVYWIVAEYSHTPSLISACGASKSSIVGLPLMSSSDGIHWESASLFGGWQMLDMFVVD